MQKPIVLFDNKIKTLLEQVTQPQLGRPIAPNLNEFQMQVPEQPFKLFFNNVAEGLKITLINYMPLDDRIFSEFFTKNVRFLANAYPERFAVDESLYHILPPTPGSNSDTGLFVGPGGISPSASKGATPVRNIKLSGVVTMEPRYEEHLDNFWFQDSGTPPRPPQVDLTGFGGRPWKMMAVPTRLEGTQNTWGRHQEVPPHFELAVMIDPIRLVKEQIQPLAPIYRQNAPLLSEFQQMIGQNLPWTIPKGVYEMVIPQFWIADPTGIRINADPERPTQLPEEPNFGLTTDDVVEVLNELDIPIADE